MYLGWQPPISAYDKISVVFRVLQNVQLSEQLVYWGNQESSYQADNSQRGGGHFGFQGGGNLANRINWGGYDDIIQCRLAVPVGGTAPTSGTFTLSHAGQTTAAIARNATTATIQAALEALSNIALNDIVVTGGPLPNFVDIVWSHQAGYGTAPITINTGGLVGGTYTRDGAGATARGSIPSLAFPPGVPVSPYYPWVPGEDYLYEVYRSPKQNWGGSELTIDDQHPFNPQHANEVAWRLDVTRISTGVKTFIRDLLYPQGKAAGAGGLFGAISWAEDFNPVEVNWSCRWNEYRVDDRLVTSAQVTYGGTLLKTNVGLDKVGFKMQSNTTRLVPHNAFISQPGTVPRSWASISTGNLESSLAVPKPVGTLENDLMLFVVVADGDRALSDIQSPTDVKLLVVGPIAVSDKARMFLYTKLATAAEPATYTFSQNPFSSAFCIGAMSFYGADRIALPQIGVFNTTATNTTNWNALDIDSKTNYGRALTIASVRPQGAASIFFAAGIRQMINTTLAATNWVALGIADEVTPVPAQNLSGKSGSGNVGGWSSVQIIVYPALQRLAPTSDLSNGAWTIAPLYSKVNEIVPNDVSFISGPNGAVSKMGFSNFVSDPGTRIGFVIRFRARLQEGASGSLTMRLFQNGVTLKATRVVEIPFGDTWKDFAVELTEAEANSITDLGALSIEQTATAS